MLDARAAIAERLALSEKSRSILDKADREKRGLNPAEQAEFDTAHKRIAELKSMADRLTLQLDEERYLSESRGRQTSPGMVENSHDEVADLAFRAWAAGPNRATRTQIEAAERLGLNFQSSELETRALSSITATQGQASIPNDLMRAYVEAQKWYGRVRNVAEVYATAGGAPLPIPTVTDIANTGEIVADSGAITTTVDPTFGVVTLGAFKYSSGAVIVPWELLQDSGINLPVYLGTALGTRIARKQNSDYTIGTGTTLPFGIQVQASLGKTCSATNAITMDEVIDLFHSVDVAYRARPGFAFMMADSTAAYIRKLKSATSGQYLWEMSLQAGQPGAILGTPVIINNDCDSAFTTGKRLILAGDFGAYKIREVGSVQVIREDGLRMLNGQSVFLAWQRADGNLADVAAVKYLRLA